MLVEEVLRAVRAQRATLAIAEVPDDATMSAYVRILRENGFDEEGRVKDYFRDGVDLIIFRRALA